MSEVGEVEAGVDIITPELATEILLKSHTESWKRFLDGDHSVGQSIRQMSNAEAANYLSSTETQGPANIVTDPQDQEKKRYDFAFGVLSPDKVKTLIGPEFDGLANNALWETQTVGSANYKGTPTIVWHLEEGIDLHVKVKKVGEGKPFEIKESHASVPLESDNPEVTTGKKLVESAVSNWRASLTPTSESTAV